VRLSEFLVFASGVGLGITAGWQAACYLYRTEDARKAVRANTWKYFAAYGAFGVADDEKLYPRICPGRYLSLTVAETVINNLLK